MRFINLILDVHNLGSVSKKDQCTGLEMKQWLQICWVTISVVKNVEEKILRF